MREDTVKRLQEVEEKLKSLKLQVKPHSQRKDVPKHTFKVSKKVECSRKILKTVSSASIIANKIDMPIEACHVGSHDLVDAHKMHGVLGAVHSAFHHHLPLVLSPDHIWICIAQGLAQHVNQNAEKFRKKFVEHEGKATIQIRRDDFIKGDPMNPWPEVFDRFSTEIRKHIGVNTHSMIVSDFSTTGPLEKTVSEIVLMDAMQQFFDYRVSTRCGIPSVTLEGTVEDWQKVQSKAAQLAEYDLDWWIPDLLKVLDLFVNAVQGKVDRDAWKSIYKWEDESGGPYVSGWIITLFPYLESMKKNPYMGKWKNSPGFGRDGVKLTTADFPSGLSSVPFIWEYLGSEIKMKFLGGNFGFTQDPDTYAVRPEFAWAVVEDIERPPMKEKSGEESDYSDNADYDYSGDSSDSSD